MEFQLPLKRWGFQVLASLPSSVSGWRLEDTRDPTTKTCFKFPWIDNCLMVTKWDNPQNGSFTSSCLPVEKQLFDSCCFTHECLTYHTCVWRQGHGCWMVMMMIIIIHFFIINHRFEWSPFLYSKTPSHKQKYKEYSYSYSIIRWLNFPCPARNYQFLSLRKG